MKRKSCEKNKKKKKVQGEESASWNKFHKIFVSAAKKFNLYKENQLVENKVIQYSA